MNADVGAVPVGRGVRDIRLWIGVVVGAALGIVMSIAEPPALGIVLIGLSLWLVLRRKTGHHLSLLALGILVGIAVVTCVFVVAVLVQQGSPTTGHGSGTR